MKTYKLFVLLTFIFGTNIQTHANEQMGSLSLKEQAIIKIASSTAKGDLKNLESQLSKGLDNGLTINESKEILIHTYAYAGFPRSIRGLQTLMKVLDDRQKQGIQDKLGKGASPIQEDRYSKYERGKKILTELTKTPAPSTLTGYSAFAPTIDTFLKEHLFADIFERDVLTYAERELVTIAVISSLRGLEPMLKSHLTISLNVGISAAQLQEFVQIIAQNIGKDEAREAQEVLTTLLSTKK